MQYKVGDRVQFTGRGWGAYSVNNKIGKIVEHCGGTVYRINTEGVTSQWDFYNEAFSVTLLTNNNIMTNLTSKLKLLTKGEPAKTFIKTGITNNEDILTPEGTELFLNWLFEKNKADFNKEVATPLLEEEKE